MPNLNLINHSLPKALAVPIPEACRISGYSRSEVYRRLAIGDLEAVKIGRSVRVLMDSIERSVAALPRAQFGSHKATAEAHSADQHPA